MSKRTKNIQVIDGADNCTYSIFAVTEDQFNFIFPGKGQDIEFAEDFQKRLRSLPAEENEKITRDLWSFEIEKTKVKGIHGTLFYELEYKKKYYPTKRDKDMVTGL